MSAADDGPDDALRTPWHIRTADLDRLRGDERLWAAYERGWCDVLQLYFDSKLMQGETDYITLQPVDREDGAVGRAVAVAMAGAGAGAGAGASSPPPRAAAGAGSPAPSASDATDGSPAPSASDATDGSSAPSSSDATDGSSPQSLPPPPPPPPPTPVDADEDPDRSSETAGPGASGGGTSDYDDDDDDDDDDDPTGRYDASESDCGAEEYATDDSTRDADSEVRRVMFGDESTDSSQAEAMRSCSAGDRPSVKDDSDGSSG